MVTNNTTTLTIISPGSDERLMALYNESLGLQRYAEARVILTAEDLKPATSDLSIIAKIKKAMETRRKEYLQPFQDHIKEFNEAVKSLISPIELADKITRDKILAFNAEEERKRREQEEINRLRLEAAQKEMSLKGELTEPINLVEVLSPAPTRTQTDLGTAGMRENWKWEVTDINQVPREYLMINAGVLTPIVKASKGKINIPGIRIYSEKIIAVTPRA